MNIRPARASPIVCAIALAAFSFARAPVLRPALAATEDPRAEAFISHLREGYSRAPGDLEPQFIRLRTPVRPCVTSREFNDVAKSTLDAIELLFGELTDTGLIMVRASSVDECPDDTFMFVRVHDGALSADTYQDWSNAVFMKSGVIPSGDIGVHSWGGAQLVWSDEDEVVYLVTASQIAPSPPDDGVAGTFIRTVLTQELFQTLTIGDDLEGRDRYDSVLHELDVLLPSLSDAADAAPQYSAPAMRSYLEANATGLCHVDLMVVVLLEQILSEGLVGDELAGFPMVTVPLADVEAHVREHHAEIDAKASRISDGGLVAEILDSSCN